MKPSHACLLFPPPQLVVAAFLAAAAFQSAAQTVEKVADLNFVTADGVGIGGYHPLARLTQVGTSLWFTTDRGGIFDMGTVSRFDLVTREVVQVASLDNNTGRGSESALLVIGDEGFFTTIRGGTGDAGTIAKINLTNGAISVLFNFPVNNASNRAAGFQTGAAPRASLLRIGEELWTTTSGGGVSNRGTIVRFNLTNGVTSMVADLDGPALGGQAFGGFTQAGSNAWYFTTFTGGSTFGAPGMPLGAGTLGRLTFDPGGQPVLTRVADMIAGYAQFPGMEPTLVGTNALYFGTTGPNPAPGAIIRYDLSTGAWTNLFSFSTNAASALAHGMRPGYSGLVEWQNELYFLTRWGGANGFGVVARFNIASNTVTKLADLDGTVGRALGDARLIFDNTGVIVEEASRFYIYYAVRAGGVNDRGAILRVALPPPPIVASLALAGADELTLTWTGGYPPFSIEAADSPSAGVWTNVVSGLTNRVFTPPADSPAGFFRVVGSE